MYKKVVFYLITIAIIIIIISGVVIVYSYVYNSDSENVNEKISTEIKYLDKQLISLMNSLNNLNVESLVINNDINIASKNSVGQDNKQSSSGNTQSGASGKSGNSSQTQNSNEQSQNNNLIVSSIEPKSIMDRDRNNVNWQYIQTNLEQINNSWATITIDLNSINVANNDILDFNDNMDNALKYAKAKDKQNTLISVANLYSLLPKYQNVYEKDNKKIEITYIKSDVLSSYALIDSLKWNDIYSILGDADTRMSTLINETQNNNHDFEKPYVLLKEYIKANNDKNIDLCYTKYYYLIKDLENIK